MPRAGQSNLERRQRDLSPCASSATHERKCSTFPTLPFASISTISLSSQSPHNLLSLYVYILHIYMYIVYSPHKRYTSSWLHHGWSQVSQTDDDDCYADDGGQDNGGMDKDDLDEDDLSQEDADEDAEDVDERDEEEACTEAPNLAPARMGRRESSRASWISKAVAPAPALAPHPHHQHTHFDDTRIEASGDTDAAPSADSGCIQRGRGGMHVTTAISHEGSLHHNAMSKQNPPCASCLACAPSASVESEPCIEPAHATAHEPAHEPPNARDERVPDTADAVGSGSKDGRAQELTPLAPAPAAPPSANDGARPRAGGVDCSPKSTPGKGGGRSGRYDAGRGGAGCASLRRPQSTVPTCRCSCSTSLHGEAL